MAIYNVCMHGVGGGGGLSQNVRQCMRVNDVTKIAYMGEKVKDLDKKMGGPLSFHYWIISEDAPRLIISLWVLYRDVIWSWARKALTTSNQDVMRRQSNEYVLHVAWRNEIRIQLECNSNTFSETKSQLALGFSKGEAFKHSSCILYRSWLSNTIIIMYAYGYAKLIHFSLLLFLF